VKRLFAAFAVLAILGGTTFWILTIPHPVPAALLKTALAGHQPDLKNGELLFHIGGCASCHAAKGAKDADRLKLLGGQALATPFGTFHVPNISPDPATGIGNWTIGEVSSAIVSGVSPDGRHYYPAFPYASYARLKIEDAIDLAGYLKTLPPVVNQVAGHDLKFPFNIRRGLGLWKLLYLRTGPVVELTNPTEAVGRGQYIVEGPGHCGECHTPRNLIGGPDLSRWLAGAAVLDGAGRVPDITPAPKALAGWSATDIAYFLEVGFTPGGDSVGGAMVEVVDNMARIPQSDRAAIAAYLKAIPAIPPAPAPSGS
jgi:mono/diheme cytochrome c family protein